MEVAPPLLCTKGLVGVYLSDLMGERRETKSFLRNCKVIQDLIGGGGESEDGRHLVSKEETGTKGKKKRSRHCFGAWAGRWRAAGRKGENRKVSFC